jgi:desulfoferrodoxin (superoxide reductase-like protein)
VPDDKTAEAQPQIIATLKHQDVGQEKHVPDQPG